MQSFENIIGAVPFARHLGFVVVSSDDTGALFELAPAERFVGNPMLRAFHGGIICSLMECTIAATIMRYANLEISPTLITQTTSFLGSASVDLPLRARTELTKKGKRIIGASARAFQDTDEVYVAKCSSLYRAM